MALQRRAKRARDGRPAPWQDTGDRNGPAHQLLLATARCVAQVAAQQRNSSAWLQHVVLLPLNNDIGKDMIAAGQKYHRQKEAGAQSNELGPPWISVWKAMIKRLCDLTTLPPEESRFLKDHVDQMIDPDMAAEHVKVCIAKITHDEAAIILTIVVDPSLHPLVMTILGILRRLGGTVKHGPAPAMGPERQVRKLLKQVE